MRSLIFATCLSGLLSACAHTHPTTIPGVINAAESEQNHRAAALTFLELTKVDVQMQNMMELQIDVQMKVNPKLREFEDILRTWAVKHAGWSSFKEGIIDIYATNFSQRELEDLIAFYQTPVGLKATKLMPELTEEGAKMGQRIAPEHIGELEKMIEARVKALKKEQRASRPNPDQ